jgi:hypothetical protein
MKQRAAGPSMSQKIFAMNLGVETISLYLLCCAIADAQAPITRERLQDKWNGDPTALKEELQRLEKRNIIRRVDPELAENPAYQVVDEKQWR